MQSKVVIYGKAGCPYTLAAREEYAKSGAVEYIDVQASQEGLNTMLEYSKGQRRVPVIVQDGKVTIGHGGT